MDDIIGTLRNIMGEFDSIKESKKDITDIGEDENLQEYGFNSMDFIHLVVKLEKQYQIFIDDSDLIIEKFNTLAKIKSYIEANM